MSRPEGQAEARSLGARLVERVLEADEQRLVEADEAKEQAAGARSWSYGVAKPPPRGEEPGA